MKHSKPVRVETAPTVPLFGRRCFQLRRFNLPRHLPGVESVYLFIEFTINVPMWFVRYFGQLLQPQFDPLGGQSLDTRTITVEKSVRKHPSRSTVLQSLDEIQDALMVLFQQVYIRCGGGFRYEIDR